MKRKFIFNLMEVFQSIVTITFLLKEQMERDLFHEYEGESPADYPGNNDEYSVSGYHYDKRGE